MNVRSLNHFNEVVFRPCVNPKTKKYDGDWWQLLVELSYLVDGEIWTIPVGYVTNFGSVPKVFRAFVDINDESTLAFIFHDFGFGKDGFVISLDDCNSALRQISEQHGQDWVERTLAYNAVKAFGWISFKSELNNFANVDLSLIDKLCHDNNYYPEPV